MAAPNEKASQPSNQEEGITAVSSTSELDDTYNVYKGTIDTDITAEEEKKVLRKIDLRIVPILFLIYMLQYLDKNSINFASVYGLQDGTHLVGQDYSWLSTTSLSRPLPKSLLLAVEQDP